MKQQKSQGDSETKKFARELSTLQYGLAMREREVQARAENSVRASDSETKKRNVQTYHGFNSILSFVDDEIQASLKKTSWKRLSKQYKTKFITEYIDSLTDITPEFKAQLVEHINVNINIMNNVDYDMPSTKIKKLNITFNDYTC